MVHKLVQQLLTKNSHPFIALRGKTCYSRDAFPLHLRDLVLLRFSDTWLRTDDITPMSIRRNEGSPSTYVSDLKTCQRNFSGSYSAVLQTLVYLHQDRASIPLFHGA